MEEEEVEEEEEVVVAEEEDTVIGVEIQMQQPPLPWLTNKETDTDTQANDDDQAEQQRAEAMRKALVANAHVAPFNAKRWSAFPRLF